MDKEITEDEILEATASMKHGRTPGPGCFPAEFYKIFKEVLVGPLGGTSSTILLDGELP